MFPPGIEPGTFRVLGGCDNHYTTETCARSPKTCWQYGASVLVCTKHIASRKVSRHPSIAQLVERWTVVGYQTEIHRSLVQIRLEGVPFCFFFIFALVLL